MGSEDSIFILKDDQLKIWNNFGHYPEILAMLRPFINENEPAQNLAKDIAIYYYFDEQPYINPNITLIYILRCHLFDEVKRNEEYARIKKLTVNDELMSLIAGVLTVNIFADLATNMDAENFPLISEMLLFNETSKVVFEDLFKMMNDYPRFVVETETKIIKIFKNYILEEPEVYINYIQSAVSIINEYDLNQKQLHRSLKIELEK